MNKRISSVILIAGFAVYLSGCVAVVAGGVGAAGTAIWLSGKLSKEVNASFEDAIDTVEMTLKSMDLVVTEKTVRSDVAQIMSNYTDGRTIWIDLRPTTPLITKIDIRVGVSGDESVAQDILDAIEANL